MVKNVRRKIVLSVITLCFLLVLLAGSTYALFTDEAPVNVTVSSAKVDVEAKIKDTFWLYSYDSTKTDKSDLQGDDAGENIYKFALGGTAEIKDGELILTNIAPGDKVVFDIEVTNKSNIDIVQRIRLTEVIGTDDEGNPVEHNECLLLGAHPLEAEVNFNGQGFPMGSSGSEITSAWQPLSAGSATTTIRVTVELPYEAGNEYQNLTCKLQVIVDAYQGNYAE